MKCYFTFDEKSGQRVLIPYCWEVCQSDDIRDCTCRSELNFARFERERYNTTIEKRNAEIEALRKEITRLEKRVEFWYKKAKAKKQ